MVHNLSDPPDDTIDDISWYIMIHDDAWWHMITHDDAVFVCIDYVLYVLVVCMCSFAGQHSRVETTTCQTQDPRAKKLEDNDNVVKKWTQETSGKCWSILKHGLFEPERTNLHSGQWPTFEIVDPGISWWPMFCFSFPDGFLQAFQIAKRIQSESSGLQRPSWKSSRISSWQIFFQVMRGH